MTAKVLQFPQPLQPAPMWLCYEGVCDACFHEWIAPVIARCPRCHSEHTTIGDEIIFEEDVV